MQKNNNLLICKHIIKIKLIILSKLNNIQKDKFKIGNKNIKNNKLLSKIWKLKIKELINNC